MDNFVVKNLKEKFALELLQEGCIWRVLRLSSLADIIVLNFYFYTKSNDSKCLFDILLLCVKAKILLEGHLGEIRIVSNIDSQLQALKEEEAVVSRIANIIIEKLSTMAQSERLNNSNIYELHDEIQYLKTVSQLKIDDIPEESFERIFSSCFRLLLNI